jgi:hypothetical protein
LRGNRDVLRDRVERIETKSRAAAFSGDAGRRNREVPIGTAKKTRTGAALALLAAAAGAALAVATSAIPEPRDAHLESVRHDLGIVSTERDGYRYEFHAPSGQERLFDLRSDPRCLNDIASAHAELVRSLRQQLLASLGAGSLEELRAPYSESIRRLEAMGYL